MRIVIAFPPFLDPRVDPEDVLAPPIGVYYVAASLMEKGHEVRILNWFELDGGLSGLAQAVKEAKPQVLAVSILNANRWGGIDLAREVKRTVPDLTVVFGGVGATFLWRHLLTHFPVIDLVVLGEGERTFSRLVEHLENGGDKTPGYIKGIAYRTDTGPASTGLPDPIADIDTLPDPAKHFRFQHLVSSRGCPGSCTFCGSPRFWGRRVRFHSPFYFVRQMERLVDKGVRFFYVSDDTFTLRKDRVMEICRMILEKGLPVTWQAISRVDAVDEEVLAWMRRAGCIQISYGVESGDPEIRKVFNKGITDEAVRKAFRLTRRYGILPRAYFIYGSPGETDKSIEKSVELISEIRPLAAVFYILALYPGTALYDAFLKKTGLTDDIWLERIEDILYLETDPSLSPEKVLSFGKTLRNAFYGRIHDFAQDLDLVKREEFHPLHAEFLSRLAMTFSHGDYAKNPLVRDAEGIAAGLYRRALAHHPDERAYLGLGILLQKAGRHKEAAELLSEGIKNHPESRQLLECRAVSLMNMNA